MLNGIDISAYQRGLDPHAVPNDFVIIKATEGLDYINGDCDRAYQAAKISGKKLGTYHFISGEAGSGAEEAAFYLSNIEGYVGESIMVLDWEASGMQRGVQYAKSFLDFLYLKTGIKPLIYMSASETHSQYWADVVAADYGLWVAGYGANNPTGYDPTRGLPSIGYWDNVAIFQYTSKGYLPNWDGALDLNVFYGDTEAWDKYAGGAPSGGGGFQPTPTPTPEQNPWPLLNIQYWMVICNYNPSAPIDDIDGPETQRGVENGQRAYHVPVDGKFGLLTQAPASAQVLAYEQRLQELGFYHGELDGIPGPQLFQAVKDFQTSRGIEPDGIVGSVTYPLLFS